MRRLTLIVALIGLAGVLATTAASATSIQLTGAAGSHFPDKVYVLTLPQGMVLSSKSVHVRENGILMSDVEVIPGRQAARGQIGVVLLIDASNSMKGAPIEGALKAARAFVRQRAANTSVAIVAFNRSTRVVVPFTNDSFTLLDALSQAPQLNEGTRIYDAVGTSIDLLQKSKIAAGSIVVLSDGTDTDSVSNIARATKRAQENRIRIFTVGLNSEQFSPSGLTPLSSKTGGSYAVATVPDDLESIYGSLGTRLSQDYLVRYRSPANPGQQVHVAVTVDGVSGIATRTYASPSLPVQPARPFFHTFREGFWKSAASAVLVAMLSAALLAFAVLMIALPRSGSLQKRMGEFVSLAPTREGEAGQQTLLTSKMFTGAERVLARKKWWTGFKEDLELAEIRMPALQIALWSAVGAVFLGWLASAIVGNPVAFLFGLVVPFAVRSAVKQKVRRKRNLFAEQLPDNLQVLASALRAGHSLVGALSVVVDDAAEPTRSEFQRVVADERLGVPIEEALEVVARRMESRELEQVALVAALQRQTGGNSAEVLDRVVDTIRERQELRRLVKTLTAQGRMSRWIVTALPLVVMGAILTLNRSYLDPLFHTAGGRLALAVSALMVLTGSYIIQRIVDIKV